MKSNRQKKILEIVNRHHVETQDDLITYLETEGYSVTQATISRDIRELQLTKVLTTQGSYRYIAPQREDMVTGLKFNTALVDSITSVEYALNLIVIKTYPGLAGAVAASLDSLHIDTVLGCVAGDDTVIVVTVDEASARELSDKIRELMKVF